MTDPLHDLKHALRVVSRDRICAVTVVLTLGLCIGANAAIFTIVNAVLLRPLPGADSDRLMWVANAYPKAGVVEADNSVPDYHDRKAGVPDRPRQRRRRSGRRCARRLRAARSTRLADRSRYRACRMS